MRIIGIAILAAGLVLASAPANGDAQVRAGVVIDRDGLRSVHVALGSYYGMPVHTVRRHSAMRIHEDELAVVYLLAHEARVSPETVIDLRSRGWSWMEVAHQLRVHPRVFVAHLSYAGPPYGKAHGYWRQPRGRDLHRMSDRQIVDYVNLAFWSGYHREPVTRVIVVRERYGYWGEGVARMREPAVRPVYVYEPAPRPVYVYEPARRTAQMKESPVRQVQVQAPVRQVQPRQGAPARAAQAGPPARAGQVQPPVRGGSESSAREGNKDRGERGGRGSGREGRRN